jgi:asparagine synthase (glutamine-hydrolysing)
VILDGCEGDDAVSHGYERFWELGYHGQWDVFQREADALAARIGTTSDRVFAHLGRRGAMLRARHHPFRFVAEVPFIAALSGESVATLLKQCWLKPLLGPLAWWRHRRESPVPDLLSPDFVQRVDYEARLDAYAEQRRPVVLSAQESHRLVLMAGAGAIASVMEESSHLAAMDGVERRHPFYDVRVLNYCLSLPVDQKLRDGWTRSILRRSLRDTLPSPVRDRTDKGNLSPHFFQSLCRVSMPRLVRLLNEDWSYLRAFVNRGALEHDFDKTRHMRLKDSDMKLWYGLVLATWLKTRFDAPKARMS